MSNKIYDMTDVWNDINQTYTSIKMSITDLNSSANSKLIDISVNGTSKFSVDKNGNINASASAADSFGPGPLTSGVWKPFTGLPRLRLSGTGTVTIDANTAVNGTGTTTAAVFTASPAGSTTIAFPFFGTDAVAVRATYTGTASAELI